MVCANCGTENPERAKFCLECAAPLIAAPPARALRKTVTVLFCDVAGSTALGESTDPEALRALLGTYFERMREIVERHGGTVEKFIGDAVMAVFGVPVLHEDDALRAVRAAAEMRGALPTLGVQARIGVNTGEVVTGTEERLATGDAVNVAARLEQAAPPGEVLLGAATVRLVRDAVEVEPVEPLALKGKTAAVEAFRLITVGETRARAHVGVFVGRERERRLLQEAFETSVGDRSCHLVTLLGSAGIGKSRLVGEFLHGLDATVVTGRCLSYGEGITYWPVVEVVKQLQPDERELETGVAGALQALLGSGQQASTDEIAFAVRRLFEDAAADRPLVVVWDDLQWGEPTFLDLIEHVADWSRDAPILLLCLGRPELLDRRPGWGGGKLRATTTLLEPLTHDLCEALLEQLAGSEIESELRERVLAAADGNPLFVEEMVAMLRESPNGDVVVPPTITALLAARLDQLGADERTALERGSVEGQVFHRSAVEALGPNEPQVGAQLMGLVRKELVRPERATLAGDDAFRFRHILIRDAAYDALPKSTRADLHQRFAEWLEQRAPDLVELDEIVGYHFEQAVRYRRELGLQDDEAVANAARERLTAAGRRAVIRDDTHAATTLLERAAALVAPGTMDVGLELDLVDVAFASGNAPKAVRLAGDVAERAAAAGDHVGELRARLVSGAYELLVNTKGAAGRLDPLIEAGLPVLEKAGDDAALSTAYEVIGALAHMRAQMDAEVEACELGILHARRAGLTDREQLFVRMSTSARRFGTTPVAEVLAWIDDPENIAPTSVLRLQRSGLLAMLGRFDEAREILAGLRAELLERGATIALALATCHESVEVELRAGNPVAAVEFGLEGCRLLEEAGEQAWLSTAAGKLAQALYEVGRYEDADAWSRRGAELGDEDDAITQMLWREVQAKLVARQGRHDEAERLAREAVEIGAGTDLIDSCGDAYLDLAEVLDAAGKHDEARTALEHGLDCFARKGALAMVELAEARLTELRSSAAR